MPFQRARDLLPERPPHTGRHQAPQPADPDVDHDLTTIDRHIGHRPLVITRCPAW